MGYVLMLMPDLAVLFLHTGGTIHPNSGPLPGQNLLPTNLRGKKPQEQSDFCALLTITFDHHFLLGHNDSLAAIVRQQQQKIGPFS